jgi:uncharacterized NAD(P)/FAD-binding protein YdhS
MPDLSNGFRHVPARPFRVAIVGAGFSGTMVAIHLMRKSKYVQIELIDRQLPGRGLAYSTGHDQHLLNVPAIRMSAFSDQPHDFLEWWRNQYGRSSAEASSFAPRKLYGAYIQDLLQTTAGTAKNSVKLRHHLSFAASMHFDGSVVNLRLENGSRLQVDKVVLALGNSAPRNPYPAQPGYYASPWASQALANLLPDSRVLLIGAGLTAVDAFLALSANGHTGEIHIVSRRGKLPKTHQHYRPLANPFPVREGITARLLLRSIREAIKKAESEGANWRAVIDSIRPVTNDLWRQLSEKERLRVFRHLKTWWDIHRHRKAPEIGARVEDALASGRLSVHAGRVQGLEQIESGLRVKMASRGGESRTVEFARVINCTGAEGDFSSARSPLLQSLFSAGYATPGSTGRGLRATDQGQLIGRNGEPVEWLTTLGSTRLGDLFETIAVPELRWQAEALANHLLSVDHHPVEVLPEIFMAAGI